MTPNDNVPIIEPDLQFAKEVIGMGGDDMERCYQCATCSVVCPLSPGESPFPRREMLWAQWGLKDKLMKDPNVFLCHQCGDCSDKCPRDAKPGDVLGAIRTYAYKHFATPSFLGKALGDAKNLWAVVLFPIILFAAWMAVLSTGTPFKTMSGILPKFMAHEFAIEIFPKGDIIFARMFPHLGMIDPIFICTSIFVFISFAISIKKFWGGLSENTSNYKPLSVGQAIMETAREFLAHRKFQECGVKKDRYLPHMFLFYSFVVLFIVTMFVAGGFWIFDVVLRTHNPFHSPLSLSNIVKIAANIAGVLLLIGIVMIIQNRSNDKERKMNTSFADWFFIGVIFAIVTSGLGAEIFRLAKVAVLAYSVYFVHLVAVFCLIAYFPLSKFAHMVYRFTAIVYAKHTGIDVKLS